MSEDYEEQLAVSCVSSGHDFLIEIRYYAI